MKRVICIGEGGQSMDVSRWVSRTELGRYKTEKEREKVGVGPGLREFEAGYQTNKYLELRLLDGGGYCIKKGGGT